MPTTIYDSSLLTKRKNDKTAANSFYSRINSPNNTTQYAPMLGIYDQSIVNVAKEGSMVQYRKCEGGSTIVNPGCPCVELNSDASQGIIPPGNVSNITYSVGSVYLKWSPPVTGTGPFLYEITPILNGTRYPMVVSEEPQYRFTNLNEFATYTFDICAVNAVARGPLVTSAHIMVPPSALSAIMETGEVPVGGSIIDAARYMIVCGVENILLYSAMTNIGPTKSSRLLYLWFMSVVSAWRWVRAESGVAGGVIDTWNWDTNKSAAPLSDAQSIIWLSQIIDLVTPRIISDSGYGPYNYTQLYWPSTEDISAVKALGDWTRWLDTWTTWYNYRLNDGWTLAGKEQPVNSANWAESIVIENGLKTTGIDTWPAPREWTRMTIDGKKRGYLTYNWGDIISSCIDSVVDSNIINAFRPLNGAARDVEVASVLEMSGVLTDKQKMEAEFWAGGPSTSSPPCILAWFWKEYIYCMRDITLTQLMYSGLDMAIHLFESGRMVWKLKRVHMEARPIQEIRRRWTNDKVVSWKGEVDGGEWLPYQEANFVTPPFADFPSGHSNFSKGFALTMSAWFGPTIPVTPDVTCNDLNLVSPMLPSTSTNRYCKFIIPAGASTIQPGIVPVGALELEWNTWNDIAASAGLSRLYGGIHCMSAHVGSQGVAIVMDGAINSKWRFVGKNMLDN